VISKVQIYYFKKHASGLTLVELMIAMALSLLLMGGAIGIFIGSKQAYRTEDAMSRNQEAGRFAISALSQQIRSAGYAGCSNLADIKPNVIASPAPAEGFSNNSLIIGYDGGSTNASNAGSTWENTTSITWVPKTDIITVSHGGDCGADSTGNMGMTNENIHLADAASCQFKAGDALLITDCESADLFRATSVSESTGKISISHSTAANTSDALSRAYKSGATVLRFLQATYFIGTTPYRNPALYRIDINGNSEDVIDNVEDMQIEYGVDNGDDGIIDEYKKASAITNWKGVLSARLSLLIRSEDGALSAPQTVTFNGAAVNVSGDADKRLRTIFNATVSLRNRLL
jgi:type IV pilus assembly protein PilW